MQKTTKLPTRLIVRAFFTVLFVSANIGHTEDSPVNITKNLSQIEFEYAGKTLIIERIQDNNNKLNNSFSKTSRACPPFCINPIKISDKIKTYGELETLDFIRNQLKSGEGLLIDARTPAWYEKTSIPSAINIPFTILESGVESPHIVKILKLLGTIEKEKNLSNIEL